MNQTLTHQIIEGNEEGPHVSLFGSKAKSKGIAFRERGRLIRDLSPTDLSLDIAVEISRATDDLSPPPRSFRPVSLLVGSASRLFGPIPISCHSIFHYDQKQGFRSRTCFPTPLMILEQTEGITHIESAVFSRRDSDEIKYQITIDSVGDSDLFIHTVEFDETLELSIGSIRSLVEKAHSISTQLVTRTGGT